MSDSCRRLAAALLLALGGLTATAARPADPEAGAGPGGDAAPAVDSGELRALIAALEDDTERAQFLARLRLLLAAQQEATPGPSAAVATRETLQAMSQSVTEVSDDFLTAAAGLEALPALRQWLAAEARDPARRRLWLEALGGFAATLGIGFAALSLVRLALRRPRRRIAGGAPPGSRARLGPLLLLALLDLLTVAAFAAAAWLALALLALPALPRLIALAWINAVILVRLADVLTRLVLAPDAPTLRLVPAGDQAARQARSWVRTLAGIAVYGWFGLQAASLAGLVPSVHDALLRVLGLLVALVLGALVLRLRRPVARWIAGDGSPQGVRARVAAVWHLPALVYLVLLYGVWALQVDDGFGAVARATLATLAILAAAAVAARAAGRGLARLPRRAARTDVAGRLHRYLPALRVLVRGLILLAAGFLVLQAWGVDALGWLRSGPGRTLANTAGSIALTLAVALAVWEAADAATASYLAGERPGDGPRVRGARARTLLSVARTALVAVLSVVVLLVVLSELGVDIAPLLAAAGVVGLAVGFGAQKLVQDVITGFFILLEDVFSVGDVIQVGDRSGLVEAVSVRNVRLRDLAGTVHTIPFSTIDRVSNLTREFSYYVFDLGVAYREDVDRVMEALRAVGAELRADPRLAGVILEDMEIFGVDAFADSAVMIKGRIKTRPIRQWEVGRELNRRIKRRFDELGIELPFPHRTIYFGQPAASGGEGPAPRQAL